MSDLVSASKEEVIEKARAWFHAQAANDFLHIIGAAEEELLAAVVLLEAREATVATVHLDNPAATFAS